MVCKGICLPQPWPWSACECAHEFTCLMLRLTEIYTDINTHKSTEELLYFLTSWGISKISFLLYFTRNLLQCWLSHVKCFIRSVCASLPDWAPVMAQAEAAAPATRRASIPEQCRQTTAGWRRMWARREGFGEIIVVIVPTVCNPVVIWSSAGASFPPSLTCISRLWLLHLCAIYVLVHQFRIY